MIGVILAGHYLSSGCLRSSRKNISWCLKLKCAPLALKNLPISATENEELPISSSLKSVKGKVFLQYFTKKKKLFVLETNFSALESNLSS